MFRINAMSLHGLERDRDEGLVLRWQPEGFLIEMAKQKVESGRCCKFQDGVSCCFTVDLILSLLL